MKKTCIFGVFLVLAFAAAGWAQPAFGAGAGALYIPGSIDQTLLSKYDSLQNNAGVTLMSPPTPPMRGMAGIHGFVQIKWFGIMVRLSGILAKEGELGYYYDEGGIRYTITDQSLLAGGTLWIGPSIDIGGAGTVYACLGPTYLYGEPRKRQVAPGDDSNSWDRQYYGGGFVVPALVGVETRLTPLLGLAVEGVFLNQQIMVHTVDQVSFATPGVAHDSMLFPAMGFFGLPSTFIMQATLVFHF